MLKYIVLGGRLQYYVLYVFSFIRSTGKVYKGDAILRVGENPLRVAIKTLKASATAKTKQDFFREADLMAELKHPNIVCLLGVVTKEEPRCMLFEYMTQVKLAPWDTMK